MGKGHGTDTDHPGDAISPRRQQWHGPPKVRVIDTPKKAGKVAEAKKPYMAPAKAAEPVKKKMSGKQGKWEQQPLQKPQQTPQRRQPPAVRKMGAAAVAPLKCNKAKKGLPPPPLKWSKNGRLW